MLALVALLGGCGKEQEKAKTEAALKVRADIAQVKLQEKADALARQASMSPPPPAEKKK